MGFFAKKPIEKAPPSDFARACSKQNKQVQSIGTFRLKTFDLNKKLSSIDTEDHKK